MIRICSVRRVASLVRPILAVGALFMIVVTASASGVSPKPDAPGRFLAGPADGTAIEIVMDYLDSNRSSLGLLESDLAEVRVEQHVSSHNGVTHIEIQQLHRGIEVHQGTILANIAADGSIINLHNSFQSGLQAAVSAVEPAISSAEAVISAASAFGFEFTSSLVTIANDGGPQQRIVYSGGGVSLNDIPVKLVYQPAADADLRLSWDMEIYQMDQQHWWSLRVDAESGEIIHRDDYIDHEDFLEQARQAGHSPAVSMGPLNLSGSLNTKGIPPESYNVYEIPRESPLHSPQGPPGPPNEGRTVQTLPWSLSASPFGWHDTDGAAGAEYTITRGNNVHAYEDGNNPGFSPDCGPLLSCDFPLDLSLQPDTYEAATVVNLFYWNNIIHDVTHAYGFDEASRNFQENNYGNGGVGSDSVNARAQAPGNCNATFGTPADGENPTMSMYLCNNTTPSRDGDLDNGVIIHEYGHGISNRLTGGASVSCLSNSEQMGEGWSDWFGLAMTMENGDAGTDARGIGTYLFGQPPGGPGIRPQPYSTNFAVNNSTYDSIDSVSIPHGVGWVWASMLWEMTWELIDNGVSHSGFDPDIANGNGGNNLAMQLVMDGMKLQPCSPGFVDGRDAILQADLALTGGVNQCVIWEAFARRGLGFSANQGSSSSVSDGTEAFDLPETCLTVLKITKTANPSPAFSGGTIEYTITVTNDTEGSLSGVTVTDTVPAGTTYVPGSATCGGSETGGVVTFPLGAMNSGDSQPCTFEVTVDPGVSSTTLLFDDFESGFAEWTPTGLWNREADDDACGSQVAPYPGPANAAYYGDDSSCTYNTGAANEGSLTLNTPVPVTGAAPELRVYSNESTEGSTTYDQKWIEISTNSGSTWTELAQLTTEGSWYGTSADLTPYVGTEVLLRFRFDSVDGISNDYRGWFIDNVEIIDEAAITNTVCVDAAEGDHACATAVTPILPGAFDIEIDEELIQVCAGDDAVLDVDVISLGGAAPVTLSAMSSPAGAAMSFGTNPVIPTGVSTMTIAAPASAYTITVEGDDSTMQSSDAFEIVVVPLATTVTPMAPIDGAVNQRRPVTFEWSVDSEATEYLLEIATDAAFSNVVVSTNVAVTSHTEGSLASGSMYHWRVTPANGCGPGSTSAVFSLTTETALFEDGFETGDHSQWSNTSP